MGPAATCSAGWSRDGLSAERSARRSAVARVEREAQEHLDRMMAEEERTRRMKALEEKDEWCMRSKHSRRRNWSRSFQGLSEKDKELADDRSALQAKREGLNKEVKRFKQQESRIQQREQAAKSKEGELTQKMSEYQERLEVVGGLSVDEAREQMMELLLVRFGLVQPLWCAQREPVPKRSPIAKQKR